MDLKKTWLNSVTRLSLLILIGGLLYLEVTQTPISDVYSGVVMTVVGFFFGQRSAEHQTFAKENEADEVEVIIEKEGDIVDDLLDMTQ